ncbi:MAG: acetyl-CoA carboxylase biotin carboxylase subunit [Bacteroidetes bacterium]|nr:acetyl-CoA carboxylase biotin carboxylase subunit [Bacteroidota bacterium]
MKKIMVANRGEIALRIMKTCKKMGIQTVAVFSEADAHAPHVQFADQAVLLGPAPSNQSYLKGDLIVQKALELGVDGIHPGYGFLSENAEFARAVTQAGIVFIGPSPQAMEIMGSKLGAKAAVKNFQVPLVPGTAEAISDIEEAKSIAHSIGFPVLIKASAGGGGKGMRIVEEASEFEDALSRARSEAINAFGDGSVFIEKYLGTAKHIEIQVLGDQKGNVLYLFERECSVQRRHQKVVEEAPSAVLSTDIRKKMGEAAVQVAKACSYTGAGTVEFIYNNGDFYFLEMNTRLQVEHPVTEMITGLDLVEWQIRIARGEALSMNQDDLRINGHAIEVRVYAEDPLNQFLPDVGKLRRYREPQGNGIRVDSGVYENMEIPIHYDPMLSKLIVHGSNRQEAIEKTLKAIEEYEIEGACTTLDFCRFVLKHPNFIDATFTTRFVEEHFKPDMLRESVPSNIEALAAAVAAELMHRQAHLNGAQLQENTLSSWQLRQGF